MKAAKKELRRVFQAKRDALSEEAYRQKSNAICEKILALPEFQDAFSVMLFVPFVERREVDISPLFEALWQTNRRVMLPAIVDYERDVMHSFVLHSFGELVYNRWGIAEPPQHEPFEPMQLDLVVAPALGADRNGFRLGYGKGHYDRFLQKTKAKILIPIFSDNFVEKIPCEPHDFPANVVISENEVLRIS